MVLRLSPSSLTGPRSYFTDLDPKDRLADRSDILRKLKLQMLTKERVIVAASSLFHISSAELFIGDPGLTKALNEGIIAPALRDEYSDVIDFYRERSGTEYTDSSKTFFSQNVGAFVTWNLQDNTSWFHNVFLRNLSDKASLLRSKLSLSQNNIDSFIANINHLIGQRGETERFLTREDIATSSEIFDQKTSAYLVNFGHFIYRLSGARVVNAEGHFPQSNLVNIPLTDRDELLSDPTIFWDLYVEAVVSHLSSAVRIEAERLDSLSFMDIFNIRDGLVDTKFADAYDSFIRKTKEEIDIHDPDGLILKQEEISQASETLAKRFRDGISQELSKRRIASDVGAIFNLASVIELFTGGIITGTVSAAKSIPQITSRVSPKLAEAINSRAKYASRVVSNIIGWSPRQRKALLSGYIALLRYGIPE
jgi:hypothetical protein